LVAPPSPLALNHLLFRELAYDPRQFTSITLLAKIPNAMVVKNDLPAKSVQEFMAYAKASPGKLSYGHAGVGTIQHLTGELFKSITGTSDIVQIPYRGTGPAITDLVAGQIPVGIVGITGQVLEFHRTGKLRVLAVTSPTHLTAAPELPTAGELGYPGMTVTGSIGLLAPTGTPAEIIEQIAQATRSAVAEPTYGRMLTDAGMEAPLNSNPETFRQSLAADVALWAPVVKSLGLKLD
jgi:tripartite-type tricarboxylate transporter receptor subunit TctC